MTEQDYLHQQIDRIRLEYEKAIKPYVDRLVYLKRIESPPSIIVTQEQYAAMIQESSRTWPKKTLIFEATYEPAEEPK